MDHSRIRLVDAVDTLFRTLCIIAGSILVGIYLDSALLGCAVALFGVAFRG